MRGLLGDRFIRKFGGDLKHWRKNQHATGEGKNPETEVTASSGDETTRVDSHASVDDRNEEGADTIDVPIEAEPDNQNEIGAKAD